jgi:hypothetical protein
MCKNPEGESNDPYLKLLIADAENDLGDAGPAHLGPRDQESGQVGQFSRNTMRSNLLLPFIASGQMKESD